MKVITFILLVGISMAELPPYNPRGWRPNRPFSPHRNQFSSYGPPSVQNYGPPEVSISLPAITTTTTTTTTEAPTTTPNIPTTTPSRSPEPTTPSSVTEEDFESNPALAIANSFAFNRPVYVYNSFPYYSGYTLLK
ncbi:C-type lectin domain-containing protein 141 [Cephus cinctus]|uniref:C-type lectin domain-containing protein 141 n=1 Tax=Cephus cinctus TaxID=211228 RepID=A0AAJ7C630_CEPCN|nr:C-type lectin domain-containing protein 141 [Cephus cinctus]